MHSLVQPRVRKPRTVALEQSLKQCSPPVQSPMELRTGSGSSITMLTIRADSGREFKALMKRTGVASLAVVTQKTNAVSISSPLLLSYDGVSTLRLIVLKFNTSALEALRRITGKQLIDGRDALDAAGRYRRTGIRRR